ncbi:MAG: NUDIX hydrolase [Desulfovermiculus sp.]|nr:NUDIX hydrolase [Desulfovermiculus sp.]
MLGQVKCPKCGGEVPVYRNPIPTVDVVISIPERGVVLVERRNPPFGWALPGGFVDYGESVEQAAIREAKEETGLDVHLHGMFGVYSSPDRDPRQHNMSVVFMAEALDPDQLKAGDDAGRVCVAPLTKLPELAFDHARILADYEQAVTRGLTQRPVQAGRSLGCS